MDETKFQENNTNNTKSKENFYATRSVTIVSASIVLIIVLCTVLRFTYLGWKSWKNRKNHPIEDATKHSLRDIEIQDAHIDAFGLLEERKHMNIPQKMINEPVNLLDMLHSSSPHSSLVTPSRSIVALTGAIRTDDGLPDIRSRRSSLAPSLKIKAIALSSFRDPKFNRNTQQYQPGGPSSEHSRVIMSKVLPKNGVVHASVVQSQSDSRDTQSSQQSLLSRPMSSKKPRSASLVI